MYINNEQENNMNKSEYGLLNSNKLRDTMMKYGELRPIRGFLDTRLLELSGVFLAGASLQTIVCPDDVIYDYDVFFTDERAVPFAEAQLNMLGFKKEETFMPADVTKMITYIKGDIKVQLIFATVYESIEECICSFDFTCTMFAYDGGKFYYTTPAVLDTQRKEININVLSYPKHTLERIQKYTSIKGYDVSAGTMKKLLDAVEDEQGEGFFYEGDERNAMENMRNSQRMNKDHLLALWEAM